MEKYVLGIDFGSDSVRCLVVRCSDGAEISSAVVEYPRWKQGLYCNPSVYQYRQHPLDYIESLQACVGEALGKCEHGVRESIVGLSFDTTAATPVIVDSEGLPLALREDFSEDPDAMFILWKDHTAIEEGDRINEVAHSWEIDYTKYSGGTYSCEWSWSKALHCLRVNERVRAVAYSWVEHCDWITGLLIGNVKPETMPRGRCAAGHKAMWHESWGGLPSWEFLREVDPLLEVFKDHLYTETITGDVKAGGLCPEWAERLGLKEGIAVGVGAIDCHVGAVGAGVRPGTLVKVMGTSTCDVAVAEYETVGDMLVRGICGQVDGSVLPGFVGFEAGQAAFGDIYAWYKRLIAWPLKFVPEGDVLEKQLLARLTDEAATLPLTVDDPVSLDWHNGRRSPDSDPRVKGAIGGLTLATTAPEIFKSLVEATAFGSRAITERFVQEGVDIQEIVAVGGISRKSSFVMQTMADVLGMSIKVLDSDQACALGAAMFAAVIAGEYETVTEAQDKMRPGYSLVYEPDGQRHEVYNVLYEKYRKLCHFSAFSVTMIGINSSIA
jgi:L-ribulokinase